MRKIKFELIFEFLQSIPRGKVTTYKIIANIFNISNPRLVGKILHQNKNPKKFPCHRVVRSDGKIATGYTFGGKVAQIKKLKKEGVLFVQEKVNLNKCLWKPNNALKSYKRTN